MSALFQQILVHLFGQMVDGMDVILGGMVAFAWWCLDYALIERKQRPHHAVALALAALVILALVVIPNWNGRTLLRAGVMALLIYLPLRLAGRWSRERKAK